MPVRPHPSNVTIWNLHLRPCRQERPDGSDPRNFRASGRGIFCVTPARCWAFSSIFPGHILGPLIVWLAKRHDSPEIDAHGKESLNFQISMLLYNAIAAVFCLVLIGFLVLPILWVLNAIFVIVASIQASDGKLYRYPISIRFIE